MIQLEFDMRFVGGGGLTAAADGFFLSPEGDNRERAELLYGLYLDAFQLRQPLFLPAILPRHSGRPSGLTTGLIARVA